MGDTEKLAFLDKRLSAAGIIVPPFSAGLAPHFNTTFTESLVTTYNLSFLSYNRFQSRALLLEGLMFNPR